jgi:carotenoid cleavage dioxygenase
VTRELETRGPHDFAGRLKTPMTAHPKRCPRTGELHGFGMSLLPGGLTYHRIDAAGALVESRPIKVPRVTMMHDFALTERAAIFFDLPVIFDLTRAVRGAMPYRWDATHPARIGVAPRDGAEGGVRWYPIEPCFVFHFGNAFEDGERIVIEGIRYRDVWRNGLEIADGHLHRWTIDRATGTIGEAELDDVAIEFPRWDERRTTTPTRFLYALAEDDGAGASLVRYDRRDGSSLRHRFRAGVSPGEFTFVAAAGSTDEDAGWLMGFAYDTARDASDLILIDAADVIAAPVATISLPVRVPFGFHGSWIAGS